jgi:hypothetical protein
VTGALVAVMVGAAPASATVAPAPAVDPHVDTGASATPTAGVTLRATQGVWTGEPTHFAFTWERCAPGTLRCETLAGQHSPAFTPGAGEVGWALRARVTATGPGGSASAVTAVTPPVAPGAGGPGGATSPAEGPAPVAGAPGIAGSLGRPGSRVPSGLPRSVTVPAGGPLRLAGVLTGPRDGRLVPVMLRDPSGTVVGRALARADGRFRVSAPATTPGRWVVQAADGGRPVDVVVRPRVEVTELTATLRAPGVVEVRGFIAPGAAGKTVELQYLDPRRGWRLWRNGRTGVSGAFRLARVLPRNPAAPAYTLRVRVAVPADRGWPFAPAVSRERRVEVR